MFLIFQKILRLNKCAKSFFNFCRAFFFFSISVFFLSASSITFLIVNSFNFICCLLISSSFISFLITSIMRPSRSRIRLKSFSLSFFKIFSVILFFKIELGAETLQNFQYKQPFSNLFPSNLVLSLKEKKFKPNMPNNF